MIPLRFRSPGFVRSAPAAAALCLALAIPSASSRAQTAPPGFGATPAAEKEDAESSGGWHVSAYDWEAHKEAIENGGKDASSNGAAPQGSGFPQATPAPTPVPPGGRALSYDELVAQLASSGGLPAAAPTGPSAKATPALSADEQREVALAAFEIDQRLRAYARDIRLVFLHKADPEIALRHFDPRAADWFRSIYRDLADLNEAVDVESFDSDREYQIAALDALCRYGPPLIDYRQTGVYRAGPRALATISERGETYYVMFHQLPETKEWVMSYFFYSELMVWAPLLVRDRALRGEPLRPFEQDFQARRARLLAEFRNDFGQLCSESGAPLPQQFTGSR